MISELTYQARKSNHDHKRESKGVYLSCILSVIIKTSKLIQIVYHQACALSEIFKQLIKYQDTQALSNINVVHNDKRIHRI